MPVIFARIELRGNPDEDIYNQLHSHMEGKNWHQYLPGHKDKPMPHAMYQGHFDQKPDLAKIAGALKSQIEKNIWKKALVLVVENADWAQSAG